MACPLQPPSRSRTPRNSSSRSTRSTTPARESQSAPGRLALTWIARSDCSGWARELPLRIRQEPMLPLHRQGGCGEAARRMLHVRAADAQAHQLQRDSQFPRRYHVDRRPDSGLAADVPVEPPAQRRRHQLCLRRRSIVQPRPRFGSPRSPRLLGLDDRGIGGGRGGRHLGDLDPSKYPRPSDDPDIDGGD